MTLTGKKSTGTSSPPSAAWIRKGYAWAFGMGRFHLFGAVILLLILQRGFHRLDPGEFVDLVALGGTGLLSLYFGYRLDKHTG